MWMNLADVKNGAILLKSNGDRAKFTGVDLIYQLVFILVKYQLKN